MSRKIRGSKHGKEKKNFPSPKRPPGARVAGVLPRNHTSTPLYAFVASMEKTFPLLWGNWFLRNVYNTYQAAGCYYLENPLLKRRDHNLNRFLCDHLKSHVNFSLISHG
jgi:hypothetical protein